MQKFRLTENFTLEEFVRDKEVPAYIIENYLLISIFLEKVREHFQKKIIITSGYRTEEENKKVGGSLNSLHLRGRACDFVIDITPKEALIIPNLIPCGEFILYVDNSHQKITHIHYALPSLVRGKVIKSLLWTYEGKREYYSLQSFPK